MTFTANDIEKAVNIDYVETVNLYQIDDEYKDESWVKDGKTYELWAAKKDENGNPIVAEKVPFDDENGDQVDALQEMFFDFWYSGGELPGIGQFKVIDYGNLGDGHEAWSLIQHIDSGRLFRKEGYYSSWDSGTVLDGDLVEVVEAEVKVVRYRPINGGKPFEYPATNV